MLRIPSIARTVLTGTRNRSRVLAIGSTQSTSRRTHQGARDIKLKLGTGNVLHSPFQDISNYEKIYVHDLIWKNVDRWPEKIALICSVTGRSYTYSQLRKLTGRLAMALRKSKILPGDKLAIILPNIPEYAIIVLAANEAGIAVTLMNPMYSSEEMKKQLLLSEASAIFTMPAIYPTVQKAIEQNTGLKLPVVLIDTGEPLPSGCIKFQDMLREDIPEFSTCEKTDVDYENTAILPFSSGTTGLPKGVELTHRNLSVNLLQLGCEDAFIGLEATETHQDILPLILPLFHIYGLTLTMYTYLRIGAKLVFIPRFTMANFVKILENHPITTLYAVPPLIQMMAHDEQIRPEHIKSVRAIVSGAATIGAESIALFQNRLSSTIPFLQGYGLTETSPGITISKEGRSDAVGYVLPNTQLRIVGYEEENRGRNLSVDETGELYVRGPQVMKGYYKNPEATKDCMEGDWFKTGDLGCFNKEGLIFIQGRLKELIKVKGFQVPPAELEDVLRGFDKVADVAVIGVPHEKYGEIPKAFVVPKRGTQIREEEVKDFVAQRVTKYKRLGFVQFVDEIPKSAAGKILRKRLPA